MVCGSAVRSVHDLSTNEPKSTAAGFLFGRRVGRRGAVTERSLGSIGPAGHARQWTLPDPTERVGPLGMTGPYRGKNGSSMDVAAEWRLKRKYESAGGTVAFDVISEGPPVVLLHGTPSWSYLWRNVASELANRFTVHMCDLLGYGVSKMREGQDVLIPAQTRMLLHHPLLAARAALPRGVSDTARAHPPANDRHAHPDRDRSGDERRGARAVPAPVARKHRASRVLPPGSAVRRAVHSRDGTDVRRSWRTHAGAVGRAGWLARSRRRAAAGRGDPGRSLVADLRRGSFPSRRPAGTGWRRS